MDGRTNISFSAPHVDSHLLSGLVRYIHTQRTEYSAYHMTHSIQHTAYSIHVSIPNSKIATPERQPEARWWSIPTRSSSHLSTHYALLTTHNLRQEDQVNEEMSKCVKCLCSLPRSFHKTAPGYVLSTHPSLPYTRHALDQGRTYTIPLTRHAPAAQHPHPSSMRASPTRKRRESKQPCLPNSPESVHHTAASRARTHARTHACIIDHAVRYNTSADRRMQTSTMCGPTNSLPRAQRRGLGQDSRCQPVSVHTKK